MTLLRIANVIAWGLLFAYMIPGAWEAAKGHATRLGDPLRLGVATVALLMVGLHGRWLLIPDNDAVWMSLYVMSILTAGYVAYLAHAYGRGPRI